jgi:hypothetical protein
MEKIINVVFKLENKIVDMASSCKIIVFVNSSCKFFEEK